MPLIRLGTEGIIDRYLFDDKSLGIEVFDVPSSFESYEANLRDAFPSQQQQINALMALLRFSAGQFEHLDFLYSSEPMQYWLDQTESLGSIFDRIGCSRALRAVFGLPSVLIGVPPAVCPQFYHTMALASYLFSAWRLASNGAHMADVCARKLVALGGQVRTGDAATSIQMADDHVAGITLESGETIDAPLVVGALHPRMVLELLPAQSLKPSYQRRIRNLSDTHSMAGVHALVPADRHPAIDQNLFAIQTDASGDAKDLVYVQLRPSERPDQNLLSLITSGHEELWMRWQNTVSGQRGHEYLQTKTNFAHQLIGQAEKFTGPLSDARLLDVFTPLTIRDWVNSPNGSAYGIMRSTEQLLSAAMLNRTSLRGLYLAGQSVLSPGILGTILGSLATVQFIIGPQRFRSEVRI